VWRQHEARKYLKCDQHFVDQALLLDRGADGNKNEAASRGATPLDVARCYNPRHVAELLLRRNSTKERGADSTKRTAVEAPPRLKPALLSVGLGTRRRRMRWSCPPGIEWQPSSASGECTPRDRSAGKTPPPTVQRPKITRARARKTRRIDDESERDTERRDTSSKAN